MWYGLLTSELQTTGHHHFMSLYLAVLDAILYSLNGGLSYIRTFSGQIQISVIVLLVVYCWHLLHNGRWYTCPFCFGITIFNVIIVVLGIIVFIIKYQLQRYVCVWSEYNLFYTENCVMFCQYSALCMASTNVTQSLP